MVMDETSTYTWVQSCVNVPQGHYNILMLYYAAPESIYQKSEAMGFRFSTYRSLPAINLNENGFISSIIYNGSNYRAYETFTGLEGTYYVHFDGSYKVTNIEPNSFDAKFIINAGKVTIEDKNQINTLVYNLTIVNNQAKLSPDNAAAKERFIVDYEGNKVKIFNNISVEALNALIEEPNPQYFDSYFENLSWWTFEDLGYSNDKEKAFGIKALPCMANLDSTKDPELANEPYKHVTGVYFLKPGLNIIVFKESGKFDFFPEIDAAGGLFLSDVDTVNKENQPDLGLNLNVLDYQYVGNQSGSNANGKFTNETAYSLLKDLLEKDPNHEFYYNCPLQSATALDINTKLLGDEAECLSNTRIWYEPNNVNNKFVISQIDIDYVDNGIVISKASKLR
jgi:hypothetical protein